jgi:phospholipase/carboxylesterase
MDRILSGPFIKPQNGIKTDYICILLHGVGADGENLIEIGSYLSKNFPNIYFVAPNAPEKFELSNSGYQWFEYWNRSHAQIISGLEKASAIVIHYANDLLREFNLDYSKLILMGFSQGAMVSIHTAITTQDNCAGVIGFSGGLLKVDITKFEVRSNPPMCLIHGGMDDVVPYQLSENTKNILENFNVDVDFHKIENLGHSIDLKGLKIASEFLNKIINQK